MPSLPEPVVAELRQDGEDLVGLVDGELHDVALALGEGDRRRHRRPALLSFALPS